jgi:hypothetical protein
MIIKTIIPLTMGCLLGLGAIAAFPDSIHAASNKYFCAVLQGKPRTWMRSPRGNIMMITWVHSYGEYTALRRCVEVSKRFQRFEDNGTLKKVGTGIVNKHPVLCAVKQNGDRCHSGNVLVTLPSTMDRYSAARQLMDTQAWASGRNNISLNPGDESVETYANRENYYDLSVIEKIAPVTNETLTPIE